MNLDRPAPSPSGQVTASAAVDPLVEEVRLNTGRTGTCGHQPAAVRGISPWRSILSNFIRPSAGCQLGKPGADFNGRTRTRLRPYLLGAVLLVAGCAQFNGGPHPIDLAADAGSIEVGMSLDDLVSAVGQTPGRAAYSYDAAGECIDWYVPGDGRRYEFVLYNGRLAYWSVHGPQARQAPPQPVPYGAWRYPAPCRPQGYWGR